MILFCMIFLSKIYKYSPTESAKTYDKPLNRKQVVKFNPTHTLEVLVNREKEKEDDMDEEAKKQKLVDDYLEVYDTTSVGAQILHFSS